MIRPNRSTLSARGPARRRLVCGVSIAAMVGALGAGQAAAQSIAALHAALGQGGVPAVATQALATSNPGNANLSPAMAAALARQQQNQAQLAGAVSLAQQAQSAARAAAQALHLSVPDGLTVGGLQVVPHPVSAANDPTGLNTWQGANLPTQSGNVVTVDQTSSRAVLDWTSFNVGQNTTLNFVQQVNGVDQASWVVLNRVVGQLNPLTGLRSSVGSPTQILGTIKAPGTVLILDQNGVMFGGTAQVNTNALVTSSLEIGHSLETLGGVITPLTIAQRDNEFLSLGLLGYAEQNAGAPPSSLYTFSAQATGASTYDPLLEGAVQVQAGASITSGVSGYVLLIGPRVTNAGAITSPDGQVSLVSGRVVTLTPSEGNTTSIDPNLRGLYVLTADVGGITGDYVDNAANGLISAPGGFVSLQASTGPSGGAVIDSGVLTSTTSVSLNGYVDLQGAAIQIDPNAVIAVTPDTGPATIPQSPSSISGFKTSVVRIGDTGSQIDIGANSLIYAPSAKIDIGADPGQATASVASNPAPSRVFIDTGAIIDAAGVADVEVAASVNSIKIAPVTQNDLANTPTYRTSFLDGATVYVDPRLSGVNSNGVAWVGSPLISAATYYQQVGVTASELMTTGGAVTIGASAQVTGGAPITQTPDVIIKTGATIDITGGWRTFQAGVVQTTQLIDASGAVVNIGDANPNDTYVGVYQGFVVSEPRWGVVKTYTNPLFDGQQMEGAYAEGRDAGSLTVKASTIVLDGQVYANAFAGSQQTIAAQPGTSTSSLYGDVRALQGAPSQLPSGGYLDIQALGIDSQSNYTGGGDISVVGSADYTPLATGFTYGQPISFAPDGSLILPSRPISSFLPTDRLDVISLNADALSSMGLSELALQTSGQIRVGADAVVSLSAGGAFEATAGRAITVDGRVNVAGGSIDLATANFDSPTALVGGSVFLPTPATVGAYDLVVNGQLNVAGRWANDFNAASDQIVGSAYLNGGEITLYAAPRIAPLDQTVNYSDPNAPTQSQDISGSILLNAAGALNVTGGGYVTTTGAIVTTARGGNVSLIDDTTYFQLTNDTTNRLPGGISGFRVTTVLTNGSPSGQVAVNPDAITSHVYIAQGAILAHGFAGGGTFSLSTPLFNFGDQPATVGTNLSLDFFSATGFSSYKIKSYATDLIPNTFSNGLGGYNAVLATQVVTVGAGQTLSLSESLFSPVLDTSQIATLRNFATGGNLNTVLTAAVPTDAWDARPVNLTLGGLIELDVAQGGSVLGEAGGALTVGQLYNQGTIRIPGGTITQAESLPSLYTGAGALGVKSLSDVFSSGPNGQIDENGLNTAGLTDLSGSLLTNGQVAASDFIYLLGNLNAGQGVVLAAGSVTDLSGEAIINPRAAPQGGIPASQFTQGTVIGGGSLQLVGQAPSSGSPFRTPLGYSVYTFEPSTVTTVGDQFSGLAASNGRPAAELNLSGASATFDEPVALTTSAANSQTPSYAPTLVWSNGGSLSLGSGGTLQGVTIQAKGGAPAAQGGTLVDLDPVLYQNDPTQATFNAISAQMINQAGFDTLVAQGGFTSVGDVTLNLRGSLFVTSRPNDGALALATATSRDAYSPIIGSGGALTINAAYIGLDGAFQALSTPAYGQVANNSVTLNAGAIDITGAVLFDQSVGHLVLSTTGDLRLIGVGPYQTTFNTGATATPSLQGQLAVNGDLTIQAAQVYPTTGSSFTISSAAQNGTIRFEANGPTPSTPYSAGGALTVQAANIDQAGVIRAPLGSLTLGRDTALTVNDAGAPSAQFAPATQSLTLEGGSVTSVSADGLVIPYGTTTDQIEWFFSPTNSSQLTGPPAAVLNLGGKTVDVASGATVDLKGGGDVYAYEFIAGIGGSRDVLSQYNPDAFSANNGYQYPDHRQIYAIVPSLQNVSVAPYDPIYSANYSALYGPSQVGDRVYLNAAPGLAAGWYTLLPAQYALLPGGMRVVQDASAAVPPGGSATLKDGTEVVSGYLGGVAPGTYQSTLSVFDVQSQSVFRSYSNIALTYGDATFAADAAKAGQVTPRLPIDAGRLILAPEIGLTIDGAFETAPATGGRGSEVDISGGALDIVGANAGGTVNGAIVLTSTSLSDLNATSLFLGGMRTDNADGTTSLYVTSNSITVDSGATVSAPEVLMATDGAGSSITIANGASVTASGTDSNPATGDYLIVGRGTGSNATTPSGQGGFLRVANGPQRLVLRSNVDAKVVPGSVKIEGATLSGTSVEAESSGDLYLVPTANLQATNLALGDTSIVFAPTGAGLRGLVITPQLQALLSKAKVLTLQSSKAIVFNGGAYSFGNLTLDTPGLAGSGGNNVSLTANTLELANSSAAPLACAAAGAPACGAGSLSITASQLVFGSGSLQTYGFDTRVSVTANEGVLDDGVASFNVGTATLTLLTPFVGDRGTPLADPSLLQNETLPSLTLASTGNIDITGPGGATSFTAPAGTPGASLTIDGRAVNVSGAELRATAGSLSVNASNGVTLSNGAVLATPGYQKVFDVPATPVTLSAPGGQLSLVTTSGDINVSTDSRLSVAGGAGGQAGSLILSAHNGQVIAPTSTFDAGPAGSGASLTLDTGGAFDLASFVQGAGQAFSGDLTIMTGQGDLDITAGETLRAAKVVLDANGGTVRSAGTIDTSGAVGGDVGLYGGLGVHLASGSLINAQANGYGVNDTRQATGGNVTLGVQGAGAIAVDSGAIINVGLSSKDANTANRLVQIARSNGTYYSYVAADQGGTLTLSAPVLQHNGAETVAVTVQGSVNGASSVVLEGVQTYDLGKIAANPHYTGVQIVGNSAVLNLGETAPGAVNFLADNGPGTLVQFIQNFDISSAYAGLGGLASQANFHARPGVDLTYAGNIVLDSNWNLGAGVVNVQGAVAAGLMAPVPGVAGQYYVLPGDASAVFANYTTLTYRVGGSVTGEPGVLTLSAGGNLDLKYSITDGFFQFGDQTDPHYLNYALGGGQRTYQPVVTPACFATQCSDVGSWSSGVSPNDSVLIGFGGGFGGFSTIPYSSPAPYSAAANAPDATGALAGGTGDPLGSAQLFPLLSNGQGSGTVVNSWSYQLVAGANLGRTGATPSADPLATVAGSDKSVIVEGQHVYHYQGLAGGVQLANSLDLNVTNPDGSTTPFTAAQWLTNFLQANPTLNADSYTTLNFANAPLAARPILRTLAQQFFQAYPGQANLSNAGVTTKLSLAASFMQYVSAKFKQLTPNYPKPVEHVTPGPIYATAPSLVRTGTGSISMAASGSINLQNGATPVTPGPHGVLVNAKPGGPQLGGAAIYTAGHLAQLDTQSAIDAATGQVFAVDLSANAIDNNYSSLTYTYGYGAKAPNPTAGYASILIANPVYADGGGDISLNAGQDVLGRRDTYLEGLLGDVQTAFSGVVFPWIGSGASPWRTGTIGSVVNAQLDPQLFKEGVGALAGGDIQVTAGRNIQDLSLVSNASLTTASVSGAGGQGQALVTLGGGDINATAGQDILGGRLDVASGQASIIAHGDIASAGMIPASVGTQFEAANTLRVRLTDATIDISAGGSATLQGVAAYGVATPDASQVQDNLDAQGFYSPDASVSILANGPVMVANAGYDVVTANSGASSGYTQSAVYPGSFAAASLTGNLDVVTAATTTNNVAGVALLYPSPTGVLSLIAGGDIAPLKIAMEDADPSLLPGAFSEFTLQGSTVLTGLTFEFPAVLPNTTDVTRRLLHNPNPTHAGDSTPNQIIAGGDISGLTFSSPKLADVSAGRDLVNAVFLGQNLAVTDITEISAGRDIVGTTTLEQPLISYSPSTGQEIFGPALPTVQGNTFVVGGPGALFLEAGRDAGPFLNSAVTNGFANNGGGTPLPTGQLTWAGGVQTVGNLWNPWLPRQSASIVTAFGVAKGQNYAGLISAYLSPAGFANAPDYLFLQSTDANGLTVVDRNAQIYSLDLITWLKSIAPTVISQYQQTLAAGGGTGQTPALVQVAEALVNNQSVSFDQALRVLPAVSGDRLPLIPWLQLNYASKLQSQFGTLDVTYDQAFSVFQTLPNLNQRLFLLKDLYFNELAQTSIPSSPSYLQYSRGYQAVNALFPSSFGYTQNDLTGGANGANAPVLTGALDLRLSTIQTDQGGDVILLGPGGEILAGSTVATADQAARRDYNGGAIYSGGELTAPASSTITQIPTGYEGILTLQGGGVDSFTDGNLLLNQSRLFTEGGGDIILWSSNANLNAGQGPRTSADFPPVVVSIDEDAVSTVNAAAGVSGAGIAAFQPDPSAPSPDVFLIAPRGTVDAGAAGVRSAGSIFVAAFQVANATGFSAQQSVSGVGGPAAVNVSAQTSASSASTAAAQAAQAASSSNSGGVDRTVITVDVLGYLAGLNDSSDDEEQKRKKK